MLDSAAARVHIVLPSGERVGTFGGLGEGPGEWSAGLKQLTLAGGAVVVADRQGARFSRWTTSGDHLGDVAFTPIRILSRFVGTRAGDFVVEYLDTAVPGGAVVIARMNEGFRVENEIARLPASRGAATFQVEDREFPLITLAERPKLTFAVAYEDGALAVTPGDEYQVQRVGSSRQTTWALAVNYERQPIPEAVKRAALAEYVRMRRASDASFDLGFSAVDWPSHAPAIAAILVDGLGRIWVFPYLGSSDLPSDQRPLDIYDATGERLFSGYLALPTDADNLEWPLGRYAVADRDGFSALVRLPDDRLVVRRHEYPDFE